MRLSPSLILLVMSAFACTNGSSNNPEPAPIPVAPTVVVAAPTDNAAPVTAAPTDRTSPPANATPAASTPVASTPVATAPQRPAATAPAPVTFNGNLSMFQNNCNGCHGANQPALSAYSAAEITVSISGSNPSMPQGRSMNVADKNAMIAYLKTVKK